MRYVIYVVIAYVLLTGSMGAPFISRLALAAIIYFVAKWCGIMSPKESAASNPKESTASNPKESTASKFRSMSDETRADPKFKAEKKAQRQAQKDADREAVERIVNGFLRDAEQCAKRGSRSMRYDLRYLHRDDKKYVERAAMELRKRGFTFVQVYFPTGSDFDGTGHIEARW